MDLRNLKTFISVAELASFTRAAEQLGFSQSTVSFQIKQLERELGIRLFELVFSLVPWYNEPAKKSLRLSQGAVANSSSCLG